MGDWKADKEVTVGDQSEDTWLSRHLFLWTIPPRGR
jgi:hypothetical protein